MLKFSIPGHPVGLERARYGRGGFYTPKKSARYKEKVALFAITKLPQKIEGKIYLGITAYYKDKNYPDLDNVVKIISDSLSGIIFYNDRQISEIYARRIVDKNERERVDVEIEAIK